jgi:hypothetical protein
MPRRRGDPSNDTETGGTTSGAALIATFYGPRNEASTRLLHKQLYNALAPSSDIADVPSYWQDPSGEAFLRGFEPLAAHDTMVIQLALNASGTAAVAWKRARQRLQKLLGIPNVPDAWWGYTLIYQAVTYSDADADSILEELLPGVQRLDSSETLRPLAKTAVSGGKVWLLDIPTRDDGLAGATVYVALSPPEKEEALVRTIYGPGAALLMPDLIAHKGYHQMRQYRGGDLQPKYTSSLAAFRAVTDRLLSDLRWHAVEIDRLKDLADAYKGLLSVVAKLDELRISMTRQSHNYEEWRARFEGNGVIEYHRRHLETARLELELMTSEGRNALGVADTAMSMARVELDRKQMSRQRQITTLLTVVGVVLSSTAIMDKKVVSEFLRPLGDELSNNPFAQLGTQLVFIVVLASLTALMVHLISKRRDKQRPPKSE